MYVLMRLLLILNKCVSKTQTRHVQHRRPLFQWMAQIVAYSGLQSNPLCQHRSPGSTLFQTFHHRRPSFSGCRLTDLELTTRHSRFGINTAVVPAPIENFFISAILYLLAL